MVIGQRSLFGIGDEPGPRPLDESLRRTQLDGGAWVDVRHDWITGAEELFDRLVDAVPWQSERRRMYDRIVDVPRLASFYGDGDELPDPALVECRDILAQRYGDDAGGPLCTTGLCLYRDGNDSVAWHGDTVGRGATHDTVVAIVSLGERRRLLLRPKGGGRALRFEVGGGDLLVMGGSCQRTWEHAVPKTARPVGPRLSVQFRPRDVR